MSQTKVLELTLAIIKPHVTRQPCALQGVRKQILQTNFQIIRCRRCCLSSQLAGQFYEEHRKKFFYNRLVSFMTSGPCDIYILARFNAITEWRKLMGPTKVFKAFYNAPDSIRALYGLSDTRNATHGSDSVISAEREINIFFPHFDIRTWFENEEMFYRINQVVFLEKDFIHIPANI